MLALPMLAAACQPAARPGTTARASVMVETPEEWQGHALPEHRAVAEELPRLLAQALASTPRRSGERGGADSELLRFDHRLPRAAPAPGPYRCRIIRLGAGSGAARNRTSRRAREDFCFIGADAAHLTLTAETPSRRLGGLLRETSSKDRLVFLGAEIAPRARTAPPYGDPPSASTAGVFERLGDFRYRLVVRGNSPGTIDIYELVAAPAPR